MEKKTIEPAFPPSTLKAWEKLVENGLKGNPLSSLIRKTEDEIIRGPLNTKTTLPESIAPLGRMGVPLLDDRPWHINAPVRDPELKFANAQLLQDLKGGASAARIELGPNALFIAKSGDLERLFDQVYTNLIPITFAPSSSNMAAVKSVLDMKPLHKSVVNLGLNSIGDESFISETIASCPKNWRAITVDGASIHDQGGTAVQELAVMAATVVASMRKFGAETAHKHMSVELVVDQDAHINIAKIRAARRIYSRIADSFGLKKTQLPIHAISSKRMLQNTDPWTNLLRTMSANFGAVIGGADYITNRPFTDAIGHATPFGYRIARNMQLMMMEESQLGQVHDAAYGSYFHEDLTNEIAKTSWEVFQHIEGLGGIETYQSSGQLEDDLSASIEKRAAKAEPVLGVTLHPAPDLRNAKTRHSA